MTYEYIYVQICVLHTGPITQARGIMFNKDYYYYYVIITKICKIIEKHVIMSQN